MNPEQRKREQLQRLDETQLAGHIERAARTRILRKSFRTISSQRYHPSAATSSFDGHYYGCISLAQAVAEGLARFLGDFHQVGARKDPAQRVRQLHAKRTITKSTLDAFLRIWGNDRNTFHHVNPDIPTNHTELERRPEECVNSLLEIESEVFAFDIADGKIVPKSTAYWPKTDPEHLEVFLTLVDTDAG